MNSPLPVINTVLLIVNITFGSFIISNSEKIMKSQGEIAKTVAESRDKGSDLDYELSKINRSMESIEISVRGTRFVCNNN